MERKIEIRKGKIITMNELFRRKEHFHKKLSRISFEDKIMILMQLWKVISPSLHSFSAQPKEPKSQITP